MRADSHNPTRARLAARALRKPLQAMQREIVGVRLNEDLECVHRMRVASRRLRNALALFAEELPDKARARWAKHFKDVTRRLGTARDLDVQIDFLRGFLAAASEGHPEERPGVQHVLETLVARRAAVQEEVLLALDRLESGRALTELADWAEARPGTVDPDVPGAAAVRDEAGVEVRDRLTDLFAHAPYVEQPSAVRELHALRIAAKHLRYTLEAYAPVFPDQLAGQIQWSRQLQTWLGEIHDCDVWAVELAEMLARLPDGGTARGLRNKGGSPALGIEHLRAERAQRRGAVYAEFVAAWRQAEATSYWDDFCRPFEKWDEAAVGRTSSDTAPPDSTAMPLSLLEATGADERLQPVLRLAASCHYEVGHTHQVLRLALRLFDELAGLHGLDAERRHWLTCAALLHDIGWVEGRAGHHKTALRLILGTTLLPWDLRMRRIAGLIARYHRRSLPSTKHQDFAALSAADQADVRALAAILRLADALDYSHQDAVADVACRVTAKRLSLRCETTRPADPECDRAVEKGDLAAATFGREVKVRWRLREPNPADPS